MRRPSWFHITTRSAFLGASLLLGLALYYLPNLLWLDRFRPNVVEALEKTFQCRAVVGTITGRLVPQPALVVSHVVLLEASGPPFVLASANAVRLTLSLGDLLHAHIRFTVIRFLRPRFILHWDRRTEPRWTLLRLPGSRTVIGPLPQEGQPLVSQWQVSNGRIEIWNHTTKPMMRWGAEEFNGSFLMANRSGSLAGLASGLGRRTVVQVRYDGSSAAPFIIGFKNMELKTVQRAAGLSIPALEGMADVQLKIRFQPRIAGEGTVGSITLRQAGGMTLGAHAFFENEHLSMRLRAGTTEAMTLALEADFLQRGWKMHAAVANYNAVLMKSFYRQHWVDRLRGPGSIDADFQSGVGTGTWSWSALGKSFALDGGPWHLPEWSAQGDRLHTAVYAHGETPQGGSAEVSWSQEGGSSGTSTLQVNMSSATIAQTLSAMGWQTPAGHIDAWRIDQGSLKASIHGEVMDMTESEWDLLGMHLTAAGSFGLAHSSAPALAHLQGTLEEVPMESVVKSFVEGDPPITGMGRTTFNLTFPLSKEWLKGLSGTLQVQIDNGVLRLMKTAYRVVSVLNLSNYLHLRLPRVNAKGIIFETISGQLFFQNGILTTGNLFLKSPDMNVGAKGKLDIPGRAVDITLRLEMIHFLEDILRDVPITHWIYKKPNKIFLPLVVQLTGPWDNIDIR